MDRRAAEPSGGGASGKELNFKKSGEAYAIINASEVVVGITGRGLIAFARRALVPAPARIQPAFALR
jgi:hypothetical protein